MKSEIFWLSLILLTQACLWLPYGLNLFSKRGVSGALDYYRPNLPPLSPWAQRAKSAHENGTENLVVLAPAALAFMVLAGESRPDGILFCLQLYFFARLAHYIIYVAKVPYLRTVAFLVGWISTLFIIFKALNLATLA